MNEIRIAKSEPGVAGVDELAQRLGLEPADRGNRLNSFLAIHGRSGKTYDLIAIVMAVLDRMDEVTRA